MQQKHKYNYKATKAPIGSLSNQLLSSPDISIMSLMPQMVKV